MAHCPSPNNTDFSKLSKVIGENAAYAVYNRNNGNPIYQTPNGEHSTLYSQLLDKYRDEDDAIRAKANIYTDQYLMTNNWLKDGIEPLIDDVSSNPNITEANPVDMTNPEDRVDDTDLTNKLVDFLSGLNVTTEFRDELKAGEWDVETMSDLLYKTVRVKNGTDIKNVAKETAYMAYSLLGRKNKIRTDLVHSIESLPDYERVFAEYRESNPELSGLKIKELIITDFLADAIMNNYKAPKRSYLHRQPDFWSIKGNTPLVRRFKYLLMRFKFFVQKVLNSSRLSSEETTDLLNDVANDILNKNYDKFSAALSPEVRKVNYEETINKVPEAKEITEFIQSLGGLLTGSLSIRKQGDLYRNFETESLHDLDFSIPTDVVNEEIKDALEIELPTNFFSLDEEQQDEAFKEAKTKAMKEIMDKLEEFSTIKKIKQRYPQAEVTNAFGGLKPGEYTVTLDINGMDVDLFFVNETSKELGEAGFQSWEAILKAKILMGRQKDLTDFINFIPFSLADPEKAGTTEGYRHFSFPARSSQTASDKQQRAVNRAYEKQSAILRAAMPQVDKVIYDDSIEQIAVLEPGGKTIRVNPFKMRDDTLAHEYGHLLIDLMGGMSNSFIRDGRQQLVGSEAERIVFEKYPDLVGTEKFDKEVVATAIGMEAAEIFKEQRRAENYGKTTKFAKWLLNFFRKLRELVGISRNNAQVLARKLTEGKEIDTSKFTGQASDYMQEARDSMEGLTPSEEIEHVKEFSDKFKLTEDEKFYEFKPTGEKLERTSTVLGQYGLSITQEEADVAPVREGQIIGTFVHKQAENTNNNIDEITPTSDKVQMSDVAFEQLKKINKELFEDYEIAPEALIGDMKINTAGTMDVYAIHEKTGKRVIFDYKTKKKYGKDRNGNRVKGGFKFYRTPYGKGKYSQFEKNSAQLNMYKRMFKNSLGVRIDEMYVIPLVIDYDKVGDYYQIKSIKLGDEHEEGLIKITSSPQVHKIYQEREEEVKIKKGAETRGEKLSKEEVDALIEEAKRERNLKELTNPLTRSRQKALKIILTRIARGRATQKTGMEPILGELLDELINSEVTDEAAIIKFLFNSINTINDMFARMKDLEKREAEGDPNAFTLEEVHRWYTMLTAYDLLDDINQLIFSEKLAGKTAEEVDELDRIKELMKDTILKKDAIKDQFKSRGVEILANQLAPYLDLIKEKTAEEARNEWLKNNIDKQRSMKRKEWMKEMDDYVKKVLEDKGQKIIDETKSTLVAYMINATEGDIGLLERWLDSPINSNDPLVAAMTNKFAIIFHRVRKRSLDFRNDLLDIVEELESQSGYTMFTNVQDMYDFMLEHDEKGNPTGYILTEFSGKLINERARMYERTKSLPAKERGKKRAEWFDENMPLNIADFKAAFEEYVDQLLEEGAITENEKIHILNNYTPKTGYYKPSLVVPEHINNDLNNWVFEHKEDYRSVASKWLTPEYKKLQEILKNENDPRTKFYNKIAGALKEHDKSLPQESRLYGQLPFVLKTGAERRTAGQSMTTIVKDKMSKKFQIQKEDVGRTEPTAHQITDETDNPIDLVPTYYKRDNKTWRVEDQSFDLGTIYSMWVNMAINYREMADLQPEIESTKEFLRTREYSKLDSNGNRVRKVMDSLGDVFLAAENKNSYILAQFDDYMKSLVYGQSMLHEGNMNIFGYKIDVAKTMDLLGEYTAYNLLGLNVLQAVNNVTLGEVSNAIEAFAGEYYDFEDLHKASRVYWSDIMPLMDDIGRRKPNSWLGQMIEHFDPISEPPGLQFREKTKFSQLLKMSTSFFLSNGGEHYMQSRLMLAMLNKVKAYDKNGSELGSMLDMYKKNHKETGKFGLPKEVDLAKSGWTEDEQSKFTEKVKFVISGIHGEYSDTGRIAVQRVWAGRLGLAYRKFVVPGFNKRWRSERFNQRGGVFTTPYYKTGVKFLFRLIKELKAFGIDAAGKTWYSTSLRERAALRRLTAEVSFFALMSGMASMFAGLRGETPDDKENVLLQIAHYTALRTSMELNFFVNPSSAMAILRSPAASMSVIRNLTKFLYRMFSLNMFEEYKQEGLYKYKVEKDIVDLLPIVKQYYRLHSVEDVLDFMQMK